MEAKPDPIDIAIEALEKANIDLEPDLLDVPATRERLARYSKARKLADFGVAALARSLDNASEVARVTGTSLGKAKETVTTGKALASSGELSHALSSGDISLEQASEIAVAVAAAPEAAAELVAAAQTDSFHVLKDKARKVKLEAEQHRDLGARQKAARSARSYKDELGMMHIHLSMLPHIGAPIVARAEADAARLARAARKDGSKEPFERYLADAYASMLSGGGKGRARRPELVVLVSHEVAKRGWKDVREGEVCKIPGIGPVAPEVAREIAEDAFLSGVFYDGKDLRNFCRWSRNTPVEVRIALELGPPPEFDGVKCVDCGNRFSTEFDHVEPHAAYGPASNKNLKPRCWSCHQAKTKADRLAGKLKPPKDSTPKADPPDAPPPARAPPEA